MAGFRVSRAATSSSNTQLQAATAAEAPGVSQPHRPPRQPLPAGRCAIRRRAMMELLRAAAAATRPRTAAALVSPLAALSGSLSRRAAGGCPPFKLTHHRPRAQVLLQRLTAAQPMQRAAKPPAGRKRGGRGVLHAAPSGAAREHSERPDMPGRALRQSPHREQKKRAAHETECRRSAAVVPQSSRAGQVEHPAGAGAVFWPSRAGRQAAGGRRVQRAAAAFGRRRRPAHATPSAPPRSPCTLSDCSPQRSAPPPAARTQRCGVLEEKSLSGRPRFAHGTIRRAAKHTRGGRAPPAP
jgi:hypothetical protein